MLFSVLTASVLLAVGISIFNITVKELALSSSGRESQFAFYAADTGIECALYWDFKGQFVFATSTSVTPASPSNPDCVIGPLGAPQYIDITSNVTRAPTTATTKFLITIPNTDASGVWAPYCALVTVTKSSPDGVIVNTQIDSRGYNTACDSTDPSRVERALQVTY